MTSIWVIKRSLGRSWLRYFWTPQSENMTVYFLQGFILVPTTPSKIEWDLTSKPVAIELSSILRFGPFRGLVHSLEISEGKIDQPQTQCTSKNHKKKQGTYKFLPKSSQTTCAVCVCGGFLPSHSESNRIMEPRIRMNIPKRSLKKPPTGWKIPTLLGSISSRAFRKKKQAVLFKCFCSLLR